MELESGNCGTPPPELDQGGRFRGGGRHRGGGPGRGYYHHAYQHQGNSKETNNNNKGSFRGGPVRMKKYPYHR
jgi:hypothetical protein